MSRVRSIDREAAIGKAGTLIEALPWLERYAGRTLSLIHISEPTRH